MSATDKTSLTKRLRQYSTLQTQWLQALPGVPWLVAVIFCAALAVSGLALHKLKQVVAVSRAAAVVEKPVSYQLQKQPLTAAEYQATLAWFHRLHPEVRFEVAKDGSALELAVVDGKHHADWLYALAALQSRDQDVLWEPLEFCVARCRDLAAVAKIKGFRQKLEQR